MRPPSYRKNASVLFGNRRDSGNGSREVLLPVAKYTSLHRIIMSSFSSYVHDHDFKK